VRIGCATWAVEQTPVVEAVRAACAAGLEAVSFLRAPQENLSCAEQEELLGLMEGRDLVATLHTAVGAAGDREWQEVLERRLALIGEWHNRTGRLACVTFDSASFEKDGVRVLDLEANANRLRSTVEEFSPLGIRVGIENSPHVLNTPAKLKELAGQVGSAAIGWLLDLGHLNLCLRRHGYNPVEFVRDCHFEFIELHVHDNDGVEDHHWPIGEGNFDFAPIVSALKARGFDGIATLENCELKTYTEAVEIWRRCAAIFREAWERA